MRLGPLRALLRLLGIYHLEGLEGPPIDLRTITDDAQEAIALAGSRVFLIEVPLCHCRTRRAFPYAQDSPHPFIKTVRALIEGTACSFDDSPLLHYYEHRYNLSQPRASWSLPNEASIQLTKNFPLVLPWEPVSVSAQRRRLERINQKIERQFGVKRLLNAHNAASGPPSSVKNLDRLKLEFERLAKLARSIGEKGYLRSDRPDGDIIAKPLSSNNELRYVIVNGKHRAAVLAALGFDRVAVRMRVRNIVTRQDAENWPHVVDGMFSREQALEIFDRIWEGCPAPHDLPVAWQCRLGQDAN